jgi:hypothetical protein
LLPLIVSFYSFLPSSKFPSSKVPPSFPSFLQASLRHGEPDGLLSTASIASFLQRDSITNFLRLLPQDVSCVPRDMAFHDAGETQLHHLHVLLRKVATHPQVKRVRFEHINLRSLARVGDALVATIAATCPFLEELTVRKSTIVTNASIETIMRHCKQLRHVDVRDCITITDAGLSLLMSGSMPHLQPDSVLSNNKGDLFIKAVSENYPKITSLHLEKCRKVTDAGLAHAVNRIPNLLPDNTYSIHKGDTYIAAVAQRHPKLVTFRLEKCAQVTDLGMASLATLTGLTDLNVTACRGITGAGLTSIACLTNLKGLKLSGVSGGTSNMDDALASISKSLTSLTSLNLSRSGCTEIGVRTIARANPGLTTFVLQHCVAITDEGLESVIISCPSITYLDLRACSITDAAVVAIGDNLPNLSVLNIGECVNIKGDADAGPGRPSGKIMRLMQLSSLDMSSLHVPNANQMWRRMMYNAENLTSLNLSSCQTLGDYGLWSAVRSCVHLTNLNLSNCRNITRLCEPCTSRHLPEKVCQSLTALNLSGCTSFTFPNRTFDPERGGCIDELGCACVSHLPELAILNLKDTKMADIVLIRLASTPRIRFNRPSRLQHLNLVGCSLADAAISLGALVNCCPDLNSLDLRACAGVMRRHATHIANANPRIQILLDSTTKFRRTGL